MEELSIAAQTVFSYLKGVEQKAERLERNGNLAELEFHGQKLIHEDIHAAMLERYSAEPHERPILEGLCYYREGMIWHSIACGNSKFDSIDIIHRQTTRRYFTYAAEAYSNAIKAHSIPPYQYALGLVYKNTNCTSEALQMFELATKGNDTKIAIEARKEISKIGYGTQASTDAANVSANDVIKRSGKPLGKRQPQWDEIGSGVFLVIVGIFLSMIIIGIPILIWGIYKIIRGFAVWQES